MFPSESLLAKHLHSLAKLLCLPNKLAIAHKTFALSCKTIPFPRETWQKTLIYFILLRLPNKFVMTHETCMLSCKTIKFPLEKICVLSLDICVLSRNYIPPRKFAISHKSYMFSRKTLSFLCEKFAFYTKIFLVSPKLLFHPKTLPTHHILFPSQTFCKQTQSLIG